MDGLADFDQRCNRPWVDEAASERVDLRALPNYDNKTIAGIKLHMYTPIRRIFDISCLPLFGSATYT